MSEQHKVNMSDVDYLRYLASQTDDDYDKARLRIIAGQYEMVMRAAINLKNDCVRLCLLGPDLDIERASS